MSQNPSHLETRVLQGHNRAKQTVIEQLHQPGLKLDGLKWEGNSGRYGMKYFPWRQPSFTLSTVRFMLDHLVIAIFKTVRRRSGLIQDPYPLVVSANMDRPLWKSNSDLPQFFRSWPFQNLLKNILNFTYFTYLNKFLGFSVDG